MVLRQRYNTKADRISWLGQKPVFTRRLVLRRLKYTDDATCSRLFNEDNFAYPHFIGWPSNPDDADDKAYIDVVYTKAGCRSTIIPDMSRSTMTTSMLGLFRKGGTELMGIVDFYIDRIGNPQTGYYMRPAYRGHGYMSEAVAAVHAVIFQRQKRTVHFNEAAIANSKSHQVMIRAGFTPIIRAPVLNVNPLCQVPSIRFRVTRAQLRHP